jgi:5-carboxyvanillate decarboxylase
MDRRDHLKGTAAMMLASATGFGGGTATAGRKRHRRIGTEEHFIIPEIIDEYKKLGGEPRSNLDIENLVPAYVHPSPLLDRLLDIDQGRLAAMDEVGMDMQLLSLTGPGVQMFDSDRAVALAELVNDRLAEAIARHPMRFGGLTTVAPQSPERTAREMDRAISKLKLNGFMINSHTNNRYLDEPFFWPVLEAAQALDRPIYLHPRMPSDGMAAPFRGLAITSWAFGIETGNHAVRLIFSGVLDRFPKLKIVLGHMGEAVHFWEWRLDQCYEQSKGFLPHYRHLNLTPSEYLRRNFLITTSGQLNPDALVFSLKTLGADHVLWSVDYPYEVPKDAVAFIENAPIGDDERGMIFSGNSETAFHIDKA